MEVGAYSPCRDVVRPRPWLFDVLARGDHRRVLPSKSWSCMAFMSSINSLWAGGWKRRFSFGYDGVFSQ